jgi:hypothetical protein
MTPRCPQCHEDSGVYARADLHWCPHDKVWQIADVEDTLDCTHCDHAWSASDAGIEISV